MSEQLMTPQHVPDLMPVPYRVCERVRENDDTVTLGLRPLGRALPPFRAGQFAMLYAFGVGEVPMSVSGLPEHGGLLRHTVRAVGAVSRALASVEPGRTVGVRGPYGNDWALREPFPDGGRGAGAGAAASAQAGTALGTPYGGDVLVVAGGLGLAPLRPVVEAALADREHHGRVAVLFGARTPAGLVYLRDLMHWHNGAAVRVTVDEPDATWRGPVGLVTRLLDDVGFRPAETTAFVCGPEPMMCGTAAALTALGVPPAAIRVSLERNMHCATGWCGHCQLGPVMVCRDGPVFTWGRAASLLAVSQR